MARRRQTTEEKSLLTRTTPTVVREAFRLARWFLVGLFLYLAWQAFLNAVVRIAAQQNPWIEWGTWIVSVLLPSALYLWSAAKNWRAFSRVNQERQDRVIRLEKQEDPERTTSGVNRDGTSDLDR